jgi:hypothetical protein
LISRQEFEDAVHWILDNAGHIGLAYGQYKVAAERLKVAKSFSLLQSRGKTVADREAQAHTSNEYQDTLEGYANQAAEWKTMDVKLQGNLALIDAYRTQEASNRQTERVTR